VAPCDEAVLYEAVCDYRAVCRQLECTGGGAGWVLHTWTAQGPEQGGFVYEEVATDVRWTDGATGFTWGGRAVGTGPGDADWSFEEAEADIFASGAAYGWTLVATFPGLLDPAGPTRLELAHLPDLSGTGRLLVGEEVVATVDGELGVEPVEVCD